MSNDNKLAHENADIKRIDVFEHVQVGQWYWVKDTGRDDEATEWLGCVMELGSNYIGLKSPKEGYSSWSRRVHVDDFWTELRREDNPDAYINERIAHYTGVAQGLLGEIKNITARLGISPQAKLSGPAAAPGSDNALVVMSGEADINGYKVALVQAQEALPELFKKVKEANSLVTDWMTARTLPLVAQAQGMDEAVGEIKDRIFNVSLYAGLTEDVVKCCDGKPADFHEKLHVMQSMCFMDEECLIDYRHGGMEFKDIGEFDAWISQPEHRDRILPFPRCLVAMRVRRFTKAREFSGSLASALLIFKLEQADKWTYLYIRNGDQVWRLSCDLEFGTLIFPSRDEFDPSEKLVARIEYDKKVKSVVSESHHLAELARYEERQRKAAERRLQDKEWCETNPDKHYFDSPFRDHGYESFRPDEWHPFDWTSVHYDDIAKHVGDRIKQYNRIATIIQGLFDRSEVLHPHPPVRTWTADGFNQAITLVYDGSDVLNNGDAPDFEAYRARLNRSINVHSVLIGQEDFWERHEGEKETKRRESDYRLKSEERYREITRYRPYGNKGPGEVAVAEAWKPGKREAVFSWYRKRMRDGDRWSGKHYGDNIRCTISVPEAELFNVSAYKPGDYKRFFDDRRTRAQYLGWAHLMLVAEEYHAGNIKAQYPVPKD